jgi:N utilization substance protein B
LATPAEQKPNTKFIDNKVLKILSESKAIQNALETRRINNWTQNDDYIILLLNEVKKSQLYLDYMDSKIDSFEADKDFIANLFTEVVVPNEKLYDYLEDTRLTWIDDLPLVNTLIAKQLKEISATENYSFKIPKLYKDEDDKDFVKNLFAKTVLNEKEFAKHYAGKTPNWDSERIAEMDTIILKMAICEYIKFPSIPVKVTLNEYLELAKEYSTPKSSIFINGILDIISKELIANKTIQKVGRGLL